MTFAHAFEGRLQAVTSALVTADRTTTWWGSQELEKIREREFDITKERIQKILAAGANVVLTTKGIDDMSLKYFVEAGAIACRRVAKDDLRCESHDNHGCFDLACAP